MRVGHGYDVHRLEEGTALVLGGVTIPHERGLAGHSDADVLLHALTDALLGAAALGDIGAHFPDTESEWEGADSLELLRRVRGRVMEAGFVPHNVDATVVLERPKLQPHIEAMRGNLADTLDLALNRVSVKATTNEGLGPIGEGEGAKAYAVCTVQPT